jgi:DNA-directed RNA polymerase subunit RPC12/RpoP
MTKEEFIARRADAERQIQHHDRPGWNFSIWLTAMFFFAMVMAVPCLLVLLYIGFNYEEARKPIFYELGFCLLLFVICIHILNLDAKGRRRRFAELSMKCPSCHKSLMFDSGKRAEETNRCPHCEERIFEM